MPSTRHPALFCQSHHAIVASLLLLMSVTLIGGCSDSDTPVVSSPADSATTAASIAQQPLPAATADVPSMETNSEIIEFKPLQLSGLPGTDDAAHANTAAAGKSVEVRIREIISALQPLQVLLGQWRGTTRREYENFKAVDSHEWVWDLRTKPDEPALVITSDKSPYIRTARITWSAPEQQFVMIATDAAGVARTLAGTFTDPPHEIVGSDDKPHRVYRLEFNQADSSSSAGSDQWQLAFEQQENNRYLLEVAKRRGTAAFARFDTVSTQREGTSFAISDSGYAEKTCIISEGLGTMEVTWKGRSYWVCCTGCKAAFEDDPETWIARAAEKAKADAK